ncbi:MAG: hypothetical protein KGZ25_10920, partial [Planctomycetes bacterium]|nr:hypothetical protein [Planctomycetota bacterium]
KDRVAGTRGGQEIARGTTKTDADGTFGIQFVARPSPDARKEGNPVFRYVVHADVTDSAGETRSDDRTISAGYKALNVDLTADEWIVDRKPFEISVHTTSLDGEPRSADGFLKIYSLKMPPKVHRKPLRRGKKTTLSDPNNWPLGEVVGQYEIATDSSGYDSCTANLKTGAYRAVVEMQNQNAGSVYARIPLLVLNPQADRLAIPIPNLFKAPTWTVQPGDIFKAVWGSGYNEARAYVEIRHRNYVLQSYWTDSDRTQQLITLEVTEKLRGGFSINVTMVRENRAYFVSKRVKVPWTNKRLDISWEHFTSKLKPGQEESWTAVIKGPDSERVAAEMVATLYDRSLDQLLPHRWWNGTGLFYSDYSGFRSTFENETQYLYLLDGCWYPRGDRVRLDYRSFPRFLWDESVEKCEMRVPPSYDSRAGNENLMEAPEKKMGRDEGKVRKDLGATAFFFPHLTSGENGEVRIEFTMPDTLTGWRFIGFAHDKKLRAGVLTDTAITAKKLMVKPNPPRFLRAGDVLEFTVRVINSSSEQQKGVVKLNFENPHTQKSAGRALGNENSEKEFCVPPEQSRTFSWRIEAPDQPNILLYRAIASSEQFSDGVEDYLPVLPRRITVTESLPLYIQGPGTRQFNFEKLSNAEESETLQSKALTVQMASNPSWYAVMALPYLMRYPFGCSEQIFNRLYARKLAQHIADSNPKIRQMFNQWKGTDALKSPLEKNEELTEVLLEETPWTRQAEWETRARQSVGKLFDKNRLRAQTFLAMQSLSELQYDDGSWPWFPGGPSNYYITLYLTTGFARLRHLGIDVDMSMAYDALEWLDERMEEKYESIVKRKNPQNHTLGPRMCMYLCTRTFFLKDQPAKDEFQMAMEFFVAQAKKGWLRVRWRQSQAHLALALSRLGEQDAARAIMRSLKERSVTKKDMGRYWRDQEYSWWWYRARIETQALMIEAFDEVMHDREAVEQCKIWLLNEKRAQGWYTTKATADAIYALLLRGADVLESDDLVEVSLGDKKIDPENAEAGTGFYEECFIGSEITPQMGEAIVRKRDKGVSWGGIHWQYLEDISNITAQNKTPLRIEKALFTKEETKHGPVLNLVDGPVEVGDELVSRLVLHARRNMEYVHLKDYRGSGTEPVNVLSRYLYADGLRYYQSTRDTATNFFIDYLPKGTYVLEYSVRVQHRGTYETGIAKVRCMYAPEFNSHSESVVLEVR